jgi:hypothetical protein
MTIEGTKVAEIDYFENAVDHMRWQLPHTQAQSQIENS